MASDSGVLEGFICPICFQNLGSLYNLTDHFEISHKSEEDTALLNQIKGLFEKAKKKFVKTDEDDRDSSDNYKVLDNDFNTSNKTKPSTSSSKLLSKEVITFGQQEIGVTRSYTDFFKSSRERRIDRFVIETNKILIRLDKIISIDANLDSNKRKMQEKSIVTWAADRDVNLCMTCGRSFTLTRRRHHCRLCGRIICNKCSNFLPYDFAKKLTNPSFSYEGEGFHRSSSNSSLNSTISNEGLPHLRTCQDCRFLLERRQDQINVQTLKPTIVLLYEKIRGYITEAERLLPQYVMMTDSLSMGERTYDLQDAQYIKDKLNKCCEYIAIYLKKLVSTDTNDGILVNKTSTTSATTTTTTNAAEAATTTTTTPKQLRLQQMISAYATSFIQENLMALPKLPTEVELNKLREARKMEAQRRIAEERRVENERMKLLEEEKLQLRQQQQQLQLRQQQQQRQQVGGSNSITKSHRRVKSSDNIVASYSKPAPLSTQTTTTTQNQSWVPDNVVKIVKKNRDITNDNDENTIIFSTTSKHKKTLPSHTTSNNPFDDDDNDDNDNDDDNSFKPNSNKTTTTTTISGSHDNDDLHPVLQQMEIIKRYILQHLIDGTFLGHWFVYKEGCRKKKKGALAREECRWDEVRMLRDNLIDLQEEYNKIRSN